MKKLALILLAMAFISCSNDENELPTPPPTPTCNCDKVYEYKEVNNQTGAQTDWILISNAYPNFTTDCSKDQQVSNLQSTGNGTITRFTRHRIICR